MLSEIHHQREATKFLRRVVDGTLVSPLLLVGPSGVGKRHSLLCMMREILCTGSKSVDCPCAACFQVQRNVHSDIIVSTAIKFITVDEVRAMIAEAGLYPSASQFKVFIIDGADRFTTEAADALLKTLEEPPATSRFFLLAEKLSRVPETIRSRCGVLVYHPLPEPFVLSIVQRLEPDASKALVYSRMGMGSAGLAASLCGAGKLALRDQVLEILAASAERDLASVFSLVDAMKPELELAMTLMEQAVHDVLICQHDPMRAVNVDSVATLQRLGAKAHAPAWIALGRKLADLRQHGGNLNLPFHLKTAFAELSI